MEINQIKSIAESLLFLSGEPLSLNRLAKIIECPKPELENALMMLSADYASQGRGLMLVRKEDLVQISTNPANASYLEKLIKGEIQESLSRASLEVLSIVAYRSPITRADIEAIRGVNCSFTLRALLLRGLIERMENPKDGRGYLYKIAFEFLRKLGLDKVESLPDFAELSHDKRLEAILGIQEQKTQPESENNLH